MNITRNNVDALNAIVTIEVTRDDFQKNVDEVLKNYKKNASIPGFRKGQVPMSLVKKQFGTSVMVDEINKLLQEKLGEYIQEEKLDILGNPLPVPNDVDWDADTFSFDFELGLAPEFEVDLSAKNDIVRYEIEADEEMIDEQVEYIQNQYGKEIHKESVEEEDEVTVKIVNEEESIENTFTFNVADIRTKTNQKKFVGKKVGDTVKISTKGLFKDENKIADALNIAQDKATELEIDIECTVEDILNREKAELNQEFFDSLFGEGKVNSEAELRERIKEDAEKQFAQQADHKFTNDVVEFLVANTKVDLPDTFLKKWLQTVGETQLDEQQAEEEYNKSENGLKYQLIEGKLIKDNEMQVTMEEIQNHAATLIKEQLAQFGQTDPSEDEVNNIVGRVLTNQEETQRISEQLMNEKMLKLFADNVKVENKKVSYKDFVKEVYGE